MRNMVKGDEYKGLLQVGQRVHCGLYGGMDGIIYGIDGEQRPETIKTLGRGAVVMGGSAHIRIVFLNHHAHLGNTPESIVRGVQWHISDEIASQGEIELAILEAEVKKRNDEAKAKQEAEDRAKRRESLPAKYPYLVTMAKAGKVSHYALGAKNIKAELARAFPGIKFSAKSDSYSGGNSIDVSWENGPTTEMVKEITDKYQEGYFNGMEDIYEYSQENVWPDVFGGAKYVSENRHIDEAGYTAMVKDLCTLTNTPYNPDEWRIQIGDSHLDTATHIINQVTEHTAIPAGARIVGLEHIPFAEGETCRAGGWHELYRVKVELGSAPVKQESKPPTYTKGKNSVLDLILSD